MEANNNVNNFTVESNLTVDEENTNTTIRITMTEAYGTVISTFFGIFTNILVVATISVSWKFWQHSIGILLLTLACVDIIGNGVCFIYFIPLIQKPFLNYFYLKHFLFLNNEFRRLSYLMMIPISVNRYALICKSFTHRRVTSQKSTLIQITTLTVFALSTGTFELYKEKMTKFIYAICDLIIYEFFCVLPLIITCVLTILTLCKFRRMTETKEASVDRGSPSIQVVRTKTRAMTAVNVITRAMIATNVAFIILTLPSIVIRVDWHFSMSENEKFNLFFPIIWLIIISDLNASINLFIYTSCLPKFRFTLLRIVTCKWCKKKIDGSLVMSVL